MISHEHLKTNMNHVFTTLEQRLSFASLNPDGNSKNNLFSINFSQTLKYQSKQ